MKLDRSVILVTNSWDNVFVNQTSQESIAISARTVTMIILNVLVSFLQRFSIFFLKRFLLDCQCDNHGTEAEICEKNTGGKIHRLFCERNPK